jgi:hypothetical protein
MMAHLQRPLLKEADFELRFWQRELLVVCNVSVVGREPISDSALPYHGIDARFRLLAVC